MYKGIFFCDVDGTILPHGDKAVSASFFDLVREVCDRGYLMCISSGRIISTLAPLFTEVEDLVIYSACNGCMILHHGRELIPNHTVDGVHIEEISSKLLAWDAVPLFSALDGLYIPAHIIHNAKSAIYESKAITRFYEDAEDIPTPVLQVTALCNDNVETVIRESRRAWDQHYHITITGEEMFDICPTDKGESLRLVTAHYGISRDRTWAFGDNENDIPMLSEAGEGFLMEGAHPDLHDGRFVRCNDLEGMIRAIMDSH